jgi:hypothetical protein
MFPCAHVLGAQFYWRVTVGTVDGEGQLASSTSGIATFVTELPEWDPATVPIWASVTTPTAAPPTPTQPPPVAQGRFIKACATVHAGVTTCATAGCGIAGVDGYPQGSMW